MTEPAGPRVLLVDPSDRGGIAEYTDRLADILWHNAVPVTPLVSVARASPAGPDRLAWLPAQTWGRGEQESTAAFAARRIRTAAASRAAIRRAVRKVRPDVVHLQAEIVRRLDPLLVRELRRHVPVVVTAHDVEPLDAGSPNFGWLRAANGVVVHTAAAQRVLARAGIDAEHIEHVPVAVPVTASPAVPRAAARAALGLPVAGRLVAALGFVREYKGYPLLAEVWERLGEAAPTLLVWGEPWAESDRAVLARLAATGRVIVRAGFASGSELAQAARAADALLLPYLRASDSGLLHLARGTGTPVLVSDVPQLADSARTTGAGVALARDPVLWAQAVTGPLPPDPAAPPSPAHCAAAHLAVYRRVIAGPGPRRRLLVASDAESWGGAETVLAAVVAGLDRDWRITVLGVEQQVLDRLVVDAPRAGQLLVPPVRGKSDLLRFARLAAAVRADRPDVVLVNLRVPWAAQYVTVAALLLPHVPVVAVEHCPTPTTSSFQRRLKRATSRRLARHLAVSDAAARRVEELAACPAGSVGTVRNGVDPADGPVLALPAGMDRPFVVAVGRLDAVKGFDVLLRAVAQLAGVSMWLLGEGPERPALLALAARLGIAERVHLPGWVPEAHGALAAADVVVVSSRYESSGLVAAEALHAGACLVVTDVGGLPELVGDAAVLVPAADPAALAAGIESVLSDPGLRERLRQRARDRARQLPTRADMVGAYRDELDNVWSTRSPGGGSRHQAS